MLRTSLPITNAVFFAVFLGIAAPGVAAPPEGKGGGKDKGGDRVISVEWRRDVWQAPEIRTMDENGGNTVKVTSDPDLRRGGWSRWSPDGLRLGGYQKYIGDTGDYGLMSIAADGTDEQLILLSSELGQFSLNRGLSAEYSDLGLAAWSPDGQSMVFSGRVTYPKELFNPQPAYEVLVWRLFTVSLSDGTVMPVTEVPDAMTVSGTDPTLMQYSDWNPHWSWSLNRIVFVSSRSGSQELWAINPDGTNLQQITYLALRAMYYPVWSHGVDDPPGITSIAVSVDLGNPSPVRSIATDRDLWILDVDLNDADPVTNVTTVRADPEFIEGLAAWSPDDSRLVIARRTDANPRNWRTEIVTVDLGTDAEKTLVDSTKQAVLFPDWKPLTP